MRVIFIRHGQTEWNKLGKLQGQTDVPLDSIGEEQALKVNTRLEKLDIDLLFSSPLERARETLKPSYKKKCAIVFSKHLLERNFGCLQGLDLKCEKLRDYRKFDILKKTKDPDYPPPGGESLNDVKFRIVVFLHFLKSLNTSKTLVCMTHGGVLDIIFRIANRISISSPRRWLIPNAGFFEISCNSQKIKIKSWGDIEHLGELKSLDEHR